DRVVQWGADGSAGGFEVGAGVDERVGDVEVVGAGGPVQRRLRRIAAGVGVGVGAGRDEHSYDVGAVGVVAGPVGDDVQRGASVDAGGGQVRPLVDEPSQCVQ